jgi:hypothetical protein
MPEVVPTFPATVRTNVAVDDWSDAESSTHSGLTCLPSATNTLPVNFAGASGEIGGLYCGFPSMCSCQFASALEVLGWRAGTIALA